MDIGWAVKAAKNGARVTRAGWNGKGMWVALFTPLLDVNQPYLLMRTADRSYVPWSASQTDLLAEDWELV